ncbi:unnamed protein product, partial [Rotaria socialis]
AIGTVEDVSVESISAESIAIGAVEDVSVESISVESIAINVVEASILKNRIHPLILEDFLK